MNPTLAAAITEKQFMQQITDLAHLKGWITYHSFDSRRSAPGFPDLVLARQGPYGPGNSSVIFAELKTTKGKTTPAQRTWIDALDTGNDMCASHIAVVWSPADWPTIERALQ